MKKEIWELIEKNDKDNQIKSLKNLKGKPIFIYGS